MWHKNARGIEQNLEVLQSQRKWLTELPFSNNLLLSMHQERQNPLANTTSDTIFTKFE